MSRASKPAPAPLDYLARWPLRAWLGAVAFFLYAPLIALMAFSFNDSRRNVVWRGFTLDYYAQLFQDADLLTAFGNSLTIAAISTVASVVLGAMTALALWRFRFPGKAALEGALALPIVVPEICMGVAMLVFFTQVLRWPTELIWPFSLGAIISRTSASRSVSWPSSFARG
jgi:spermidine/putrescine transport system permease protein